MGSNKPQDMEWASSGVNVADPPGAKKISGWVGLDIPPNTWINWLHGTAVSWINYLADFATRSADSYVISGFEVTELGVPSVNQVQLAAGEAVANGVHVDSTGSAGLIIASNAGTAAPGAPEFFLIVINENGSIGQINLGTFANRHEAIRAILPDVGTHDEASVSAPSASSPPRAMIALVVNEDGEPVYNNGQILDVRQLQPVSGRLVEPMSQRQNQMIDPGLIMELDFTTEDETQAKEHRFDLIFKDFGHFGVSDLLRLREDILLTITVHPMGGTSTPGDLGTVAIAYREVYPYAEAPGGQSNHLGVQINQDTGAGLAVLSTLNGDSGSINHWAGVVRPRADRIRVTFARAAALPIRSFMVTIRLDHGAPITQIFTFRAT